jgi:hypothetical protein
VKTGDRKISIKNFFQNADSLKENLMKKLFFLFSILTFTLPRTTAAETLTFTTYYPAPFGAYDRLRLVPRDPSGMVCNAASLGTIFIDNVTNTLKICSNPSGPDYQLLNGVWIQDGDNIFPYNTATNPDIKVGIGTANPDYATFPAFKLHLNSNPLPGQLAVFGADISSGNTHAAQLGLQTTGAPGTPIRLIFFDHTASTASIVSAATSPGPTYSGYLAFATRKNNSAQLERMRIDENGNVGIGTSRPQTKLHVDEGALLSTGTYNSGWTEPNLGAGTRMLWYPRKAAFRAGTVSGTQWNNNNIGIISLATGEDTTASGEVATAMGYKTTASGEVATAIGVRTEASGSFSVATGYETEAKNCSSTATGYKTKASGFASTSMGISTTAQALASVVMGRWNIFSGDRDNWVATDPLFVIGNGTSDGARSNALTVLKDGKVGLGTAAPQGTLEVTSTTGAFIPPRMTTAQRASLPAVEGSIIYNTDTGKLNFYDGVNLLWTEL